QEYFSPVRIGSNVEPEIVMAQPIRTAGRVEAALVATVNLTEMWSLVETLAPPAGVAKLLDGDHRLIAASGDDDKELVFQLAPDPIAAQGIPEDAPRVREGVGRAGRLLRASAPIPELRWRVALEQPVAVAFAAVNDQQRRLAITVVLFL